MELQHYVDAVRHELAVAAAAGGADAVELADRLTAPLESAIRLAILEALSDAAEEITRELAPASVDVRLRGREPQFAVTPAPSDPISELSELTASPESDDDGGTWRVTLRCPTTCGPAWMRRPAAPGCRSTPGWSAPSAPRSAPTADDPTGGRPPPRTTTSAAGSADTSTPTTKRRTVMPIFDTPEPITAILDLGAGSVRLVATDRDDTTVEVSPRDPNRASDVRASEQARIDFRHGTLRVSAGRRMMSLGRGGAVNVDIGLPARSRLHASSASAEVRTDGLFADCRLASASGDLLVDSVTGRSRRTPHPARSPSKTWMETCPSRRRRVTPRSAGSPGT